MTFTLPIRISTTGRVSVSCALIPTDRTMLMMVDDNGTLFSNNPSDGSPATIFYRPHETWTTRADWRTQLPQGEFIRGET